MALVHSYDGPIDMRDVNNNVISNPKEEDGIRLGKDGYCSSYGYTDEEFKSYLSKLPEITFVFENEDGNLVLTEFIK